VTGVQTCALPISLPVLHPLLFMTGTESHPALADALAEAGCAKGLKLVPTLNRYVGDMSDHGVFREHGVPYLFLSCGRWAHYHKKTDTPERLNYRKMERIARQLQQLCRTLDTTPLPRPKAAVEHICDTLDLEIAHMRSSFGPVLPLLLRRAGLDTLKTREDMDRLVASILETGV